MPSIKSLLILAGVLALVFGSPIEERKTPQRFSLEQVPHGKKSRSGAIALAKTYKKYRAPIPMHVAIAAAAAAAAPTGSAANNPEQFDEEYLSPVQIGAQSFMMNVDTGSSDFWVFSNQLPASQASGQAEYTVSSANLKTGYSWSIIYGDDSAASGNVYGDKVVIGGVTATSQAVEAATSVSSALTDDSDNDGFVGLAFSSINTVQPTKQATWFDNVKGSLTKALFTATLKHGAPGTYDFGYIDPSKYTGSIVYTTVTTANGLWEFSSPGYAIGSGSSKAASIQAFADTGTTLLLLPNAVVQDYWGSVNGATYDSTWAGYVFPCAATLPTFSLILAGVRRTVPGSYLNFAPISSTTCFGGLQADTGLNISIVGDVFLKSQYVVFDQSQTKPRIGWAQQA